MRTKSERKIQRQYGAANPRAFSGETDVPKVCNCRIFNLGPSVLAGAV